MQNSAGRSAAVRRRRNRWRGRLATGATLAAVLLVVAGPSAWADLTGPAARPGVDAPLSIAPALGAAGFTEPVAGLLPGDVVRRYVDLVGTGGRHTADAALTVTAAGSRTLRTDTPAGTRGLRLSVSACTGPWAPATGTCSGTTTQVLAPTVLGSLPGAVPIAARGDLAHLQLTLALPDQDETTVNGVRPATTVQGQTARITYTFAAVVTPRA